MIWVQKLENFQNIFQKKSKFRAFLDHFPEKSKIRTTFGPFSKKVRIRTKSPIFRPDGGSVTIIVIFKNKFKLFSCLVSSFQIFWQFDHFGHIQFFQFFSPMPYWIIFF